MIGIYRIWRMIGELEYSYIGQSNDILKRWSEHEKSGRTAFGNTKEDEFHRDLYENPGEYHFEILELCEPEKLSEKEALWIKCFNSCEWGWNSTEGTSQLYTKKKEKPTEKEVEAVLTKIIGQPLFKEDKERLINFLQLTDSRGNSLRWPSVKKLIFNYNLDIMETKRNGKNCSIVKLRKEN